MLVNNPASGNKNVAISVKIFRCDELSISAIIFDAKSILYVIPPNIPNNIYADVVIITEHHVAFLIETSGR
jgi:hypothetical protein